MKVVINDCVGGFGLSRFAIVEFYRLKNKKVFIYKQTKFSHNKDIVEYKKMNNVKDKDYGFYDVTLKNYGDTIISPKDDFYKDVNKRIREIDKIKRDDADLIKVVEMLGEKANGEHAELKIINIPNNIKWEIDENEMGLEWVAEKHRTWG